MKPDNPKLVDELLHRLWVFFILLAFIPWLTDFIETGRWPSSFMEFTTEIVGSATILFIGLILYRNLKTVRRQRAELEELAITDPISALYNLRHFHTVLQDEIRRAKRQKLFPSLLFMDIDKFKAFNDTYGHQAGDQILKTVGRIVRHSIRGGMDTGFRYGGDEFAVILPATDGSQAEVVADRLRKSFSDNTGCSISIGIAVMHPEDDASSLLARADQAMYQAKKKGSSFVFQT